MAAGGQGAFVNNFFIRVYAGLMLAVVVVGLLSYGGIHLVNQYRSMEYREHMARGTFYLAALSLSQQHTQAELATRQQFLSRLLGADIRLLRPEEVPLKGLKRRQLEKGRVQVQVREAGGVADIYYHLPDSTIYLHTAMDKVSEQQARATALLLLEALNQYPRVQWPEALARIQEQFGYELSLEDSGEVYLDPEQRQRLLQHEVVLALDERGQRENSTVKLYLLAGEGQVLVLGPLELFDWMPLGLLVVVVLWGLIAMGLAAYLLSRPLQLRLAELDAVVRRVGSGDLEARVQNLKQDGLSQLGSTINGMTVHIQRLIQAQQEMVRAVSHELRTPVARLRFGIDMLAETDDKAKRLVQLEELDADIEQLNELIDEILTYARLEQGSPALHLETVVVKDLLRDLVHLLSPREGEVQLRDTTRWEALSQQQWQLWVDETYLARLLQNLITNALRYAQHQVSVSYTYHKGEAIFYVDDDGPGIPEGEREKIFEPFARLDESRHRGSGGYGLGLSIVKRIAQWHSGSVSIAESPLGGARFVVRLPVKPTQTHALGEQASRQHKR